MRESTVVAGWKAEGWAEGCLKGYRDSLLMVLEIVRG